MFSAEQYRALREGVGVVERSDRGLLRFTGADRTAFLQGLLTNDVAALTPGTGCYAAFLTAQGRMIADMRVFELGDVLLIDLDAGQAASIRDRFDQMIFSEDAQVQDASGSTRQLGVYGPAASRAVSQALGGVAAAALDGLPLHATTRVALPAGEATIARSQEIGAEGFDLFVPAAEAAAVIDRLRAAGAIDVGAETADVSRIEAGRPRFHVDMDEDTIPLEAGIEDRAISLTKGCYVGQEIIIRVLHRGHGRVAKRLAGLTFEPGASVPARGDAIKAGDRQVGSVTSAAFSPALGRPIALGYVHRDFADAATPLTVMSSASAQPAAVTALPFVSATAASAR